MKIKTAFKVTLSFALLVTNSSLTAMHQHQPRTTIRTITDPNILQEYAKTHTTFTRIPTEYLVEEEEKSPRRCLSQEETQSCEALRKLVKSQQKSSHFVTTPSTSTTTQLSTEAFLVKTMELQTDSSAIQNYQQMYVKKTLIELARKQPLFEIIDDTKTARRYNCPYLGWTNENDRHCDFNFDNSDDEQDHIREFHTIISNKESRRIARIIEAPSWRHPYESQTFQTNPYNLTPEENLGLFNTINTAWEKPSNTARHPLYTDAAYDADSDSESEDAVNTEPGDDAQKEL